VAFPTQTQEVEWVHQFGTAMDEQVSVVAVDPAGNIYVAGEVPAGQSLTPDPSSGGADVFVRKYLPDGTVAWTRQFGSPAYDSAMGDRGGIAADAAGNVYVVGRTDGVLPGESSAGGSDAFVRKYNTAGDVQWTRQFGTSMFDNAVRIVVDVNDNAYVVGATTGVFPARSRREARTSSCAS
jgi:hypothetical protein